MLSNRVAIIIFSLFYMFVVQAEFDPKKASSQELQTKYYEACDKVLRKLDFPRRHEEIIKTNANVQNQHRLLIRKQLLEQNFKGVSEENIDGYVNDFLKLWQEKFSVALAYDNIYKKIADNLMLFIPYDELLVLNQFLEPGANKKTLNEAYQYKLSFYEEKLEEVGLNTAHAEINRIRNEVQASDELKAILKKHNLLFS